MVPVSMGRTVEVYLKASTSKQKTSQGKKSENKL